MSDRLRLALVYDIDACRGPTGVTRHAMAQLSELSKRTDIALRAVSGRIREPDGLMFWETLDAVERREMPLSTRNMLRLWRCKPWPPVDWWTGSVDWVYSPAEYFVPTKKAKLAVTSHDIRQDLTLGGPKRRERLRKLFSVADRVLSVSQFNTSQLLDAFPDLKDRVSYVPNAADDLFFEEATERERGLIRADLGLPVGLPYLLSVANFQPRKNLTKLVEAVGRLSEVVRGELGLVLIGNGTDSETEAIRRVIAALPRTAIVKLPGYRQGKTLRAVYAEATALVFPSTCESFGIPVVEAMAQGCPVVLAKNTALPEIGGQAGWYFDPENVESIAGTIRDLLNDEPELDQRMSLGREIASGFRWSRSCERLVEALD
jgi:glycosyltransferase involved in cell wall biosynthesis